MRARLPVLSQLGKHRALLAKKSTKAAPSVHAKAALNAKLSLLTEAKAPNKRSKVTDACQSPPLPLPPSI